MHANGAQDRRHREHLSAAADRQAFHRPHRGGVLSAGDGCDFAASSRLTILHSFSLPLLLSPCQGDKERELGLTITPLFDRTKPGVSKGQKGFLDFIAMPLVSAFVSVFPECMPLLEQMQSNYE